MKSNLSLLRIGLAVLIVAFVAPLALGQGTFLFANSPSTLVRYQTNYVYSYPPSPADLSPVPVGGGRVEFLWAPLGTTDWNLFQPLGAPVTIGPGAGRFSGGVRTIPAGSGFSGIAPGDTVSALIRGWTGTALTWNEAMYNSGMIGYSAIFTIDTGNPLTVPAEIPASIVTSTANGFSGLDMVYIPEPSSLALAGLGAASLLLFRRRK